MFLRTNSKTFVNLKTKERLKMNIIAFLVTYARKHLFGTSNGHEPSPELRLAAAAKEFDAVLLGLSPHVDEMLKQKAEVRAKTLGYFACIGDPNLQARVTALDMAEDKLDHLVNQNIRRLSDLADRYAGLTAEHAYQNLVFADWGAEANALQKSAQMQLVRHRKEFTDMVAQVRFGKNVALPDDGYLQERLRLLRSRAKFRRSGMSYSTEKEEATSISRNLMNKNAHLGSW